MNFDDFDIWWRERGDTEYLDEMRVQLEKALLHKPSRDIEYSIRWRLARWHHFAAMTEEANQTKARTHFSRGAHYAKRAISLKNVNGREARFWWSVNALEAARLRSKICILYVLPRATKVLSKIARDDEAFHFAGALRVLGRITHLKPRFLGGGARKSLSYFKDALEISPDNSTTLLYFAEALRDADEREKSVEVLQQIIAQAVDDEWKWEQARDREWARALLQNKR